MLVPSPSRVPINLDSPATNDFNRPIPTAVAMSVAAVQESPLSMLGGDLRFSRVVNFNLPPSIEDLIRAVPEDDLLDANQDEKEANIQEEEDQNHGEAQAQAHSNQRITRSMARSLGRDCQMKSLFVISLVLNCK